MRLSIYTATRFRRALLKNVVISLTITTLCHPKLWYQPLDSCSVGFDGDPEVWYRPLAFSALIIPKKTVFNSLVGLLGSREARYRAFARSPSPSPIVKSSNLDSFDTTSNLRHADAFFEYNKTTQI